MAIVKSQHAKGLKQTIRPQTAGAVHVTQFTYDLGVEGALAAGDILELGIIPPYARIDQATGVVGQGQTQLVRPELHQRGKDGHAEHGQHQRSQ